MEVVYLGDGDLKRSVALVWSAGARSLGVASALRIFNVALKDALRTQSALDGLVRTLRQEPAPG